jgi:bifunctional non-homologous end joining protein LigD
MHDQITVVEDRAVKLSNLQKVLFPAAGLTKADLIDYYRRVARVMLPHLAGRPLSFERYPEGIGTEGFMQKNASDYFPSWLRRVRLAKQDGLVDHIVAEDQAAVIYLANQACITFHVWLSRIDRVDYPDRMVFDLDPSDDDFGKVKRAAREARACLRGSAWCRSSRSPARAASISGCRSTVRLISIRCASSPRRWRNGWSRAGPGN